jgi:hypothetical protein
LVRLVVLGASLPNPLTQIAIAVDTAYVAGYGGQHISTGIYVMDNQLNAGSTGEGGMAIQTHCSVGSLIGYTSYPVDTGSGDTAAISGFSILSGSVFGSAGYPIQQTPNYWVAQAMYFGSQAYEIQLCVTAGVLRPTKFYVSVECQLDVP